MGDDGCYKMLDGWMNEFLKKMLDGWMNEFLKNAGWMDERILQNGGLPKPIWSSEQVASLDVHKILLVLQIKALRVGE